MLFWGHMLWNTNKKKVKAELTHGIQSRCIKLKRRMSLVGKGSPKGASALWPFRDSGPQSGPCSPQLILTSQSSLQQHTWLYKKSSSSPRVEPVVKRGNGQGRLQSAKLGFTQRAGDSTVEALAQSCVCKREQWLRALWKPWIFWPVLGSRWSLNLYFNSHSWQMKMFSASCLKEKQKRNESRHKLF